MSVDIGRLSLGMHFEVGDYYIVHPLTIGDIVEMGYDTLREHLSTLLLDWNSFKNEVPEEHKTDKALYDTLKYFYFKDEDFYEKFNEACVSFLKRPLSKKRREMVNQKTFERIEKFFTKEVLGEIKNIIRAQYLIREVEEEEVRVFANEQARKLYERIKRNKIKAEKYKKKAPEFVDYISSIRWKLKMPKSELLNLTIYELYEGLNRTQLNDRVEHLFTGIYSGSISAKSIDEEELQWITHIELI